MPHNLATYHGQTMMMFVGPPPWHGLGTPLAKPATAEEAIKAAHLDWEVFKAPLYAVKDGVSQRLPHNYAMVRKDLWNKPDCPTFGIVGEGYTPLQNRDAFKFFDPIVGENAAVYETAGALGQGERIWILAKLPGHIKVVGEDITDKYLLLSNSHDGLSSVQIKFTPIRVVCQNTLTQALSQGPALRIQHTRDVKRRVQDAQQLLGLVNRRYDGLAETFKLMARLKINQERLAEYLKAVFPDPRKTDPEDEDDNQALRRVQQARFKAEVFFVEGRGNKLGGVAGTLWAAYNGVTEMIDYPLTGTGQHHLESIWFGEGY